MSQSWFIDGIGDWDETAPSEGVLVAGDINGQPGDEAIYVRGSGMAVATVQAVDGHPSFASNTVVLPFGLSKYYAANFYASAPVLARLGDLDGDGLNEVVLIGENETQHVQLLVMWNDGGSFATASHSELALPDGTSAFLLFNADPDPALEVLVADGDSLLLLDANGREGFEQRQVELDAAVPWIVSMAAADLDRDGVVDLALGHDESVSLLRSVPRNESND
jgi:hypothetical protein